MWTKSHLFLGGWKGAPRTATTDAAATLTHSTFDAYPGRWTKRYGVGGGEDGGGGFREREEVDNNISNA